MKSKRIVSLILSAAMVTPLLPVWAEGEVPQQPDEGLQAAETQPLLEPEAIQSVLNELIYNQEKPETKEEGPAPQMKEEMAQQEVVTTSGSPDGTLESTTGYWHDSMEQYQEFDYSDPMWVSDEDFFGKWNGNEWTKKPTLDYSFGPLLQDAEDAVKAGDYAQAKEYIFQYYKEKFEGQPRTLSKSADRRVALTAEIQFDNLFYNKATGFNPSDRISVPNSEDWVSGNVIEEVQDALKASSKIKCFVLVALKKDGHQVDFDSSESGDNQPYVEVVVNGNLKKFYATDDAMISAGTNADKNYGNDTTMSVKEGAEPGNQPLGEKPGTTSYYQPVNADTKRVYLKFNFDGLTDGDEITEARLYLHGKSTKPEGNKDIILFSNTNAEWNEKTVTFGNLEHLIYSYDLESGPKWEQPETAGYRFHEEINRFENYASAMRQRYIYTKDDVYAYHGLRLMLDLYKKKGYNPYWENNLDLGVRAQSIINTFAYYMDSSFMTKETFIPLLKFSWQMGNSLVERWNEQSSKTNWGSYETAGLSTLAINLNEFYDATKPMEDGWESTPFKGGRGGWIEVAAHRYALLAGNVLNSDGSCTEVSLEYASEAIGNLMQQLDIAQAAGWNDFVIPDTLKPMLATLASYLVNASGPGFVDFQQGNASAYDHSYISAIKRVQTQVDDPLLNWAATDGKEGTKPDYTSILYPVGVKSIFRSGWDEKAVYIQSNADGGVVSHGHFDDMALNMFAYGQYLLIDPKYMNYDMDNPYRAWLMSNRGHNTIEINDTSQKANTWNFNSTTETVTGPSGETLRLPMKDKGAAGSIKDSELNDGYDYVHFNTPNYLDVKIGTSPRVQMVDVDYDRSILFIRPGYAIVTDYLKPQDDKVNKYSQGWHFLPDANISLDEETGKVRTNFADAPNIEVIPVQQSDEMEPNILDGWNSHSTGHVEPAKYATYVKNQSGITTFNTVLLPMDKGQNLVGTTDNLSLDVPESVANAFNLTIEEDARSLTTEGTYYTLLDQTQKAQREIGQYSTDATLAYLEQENGIYSRLILRNGTNAVNQESGIKLIRSKREVEDLSVDYNSSKLSLNSSKEISLEDLQLYSGGTKISEVTLNDIAVSFKQDGKNGDIYFTASMPFEGNEADDNIDSGNSGTTTPKPPTGGSIHGGGGGGSVTTPKPSVTPGPSETPGLTPTPVPTVSPSGKPSEKFEEELSGHWAENEIKEMLDDNIIQGTGPDTLGLKNDTTRAEFVTMLIRALGIEMKPYSGDFADVGADDWYADYMATAKAEGIMHGDGTNANPNAVITREEMAKILVETYEKENGEIAVKPEVEQQFQDLDSASSWANTYIQKAVSAGLMNGVGDAAFAPTEGALREQAIVVVYRVMKDEKKE